MQKIEVTKHTEIYSNDTKQVFGFWIYLMTDLIMFSVLFATFAVLRNNTFGGPTGREIFDLPQALAETIILLTSSFTSGLGLLFARRGNLTQTLTFFTLTFLLGVSFLVLELSEFSHLFSIGQTFQKSAFLSAFFTLVGTHGIHITAGLLWLVILIVYMLRRGINQSALQKLTLFALFWHFLDIVWIFIFTIVYLFSNIL
jgi:cytochrome o ubiquinol oxidase subunit 3